MSKNIFFIKIRNNIELDTDIAIATNEASYWFTDAAPVTCCDQVTTAINLDKKYILRHANQKLIGFLASNARFPLHEFVRKSVFFQELWLLGSHKSSYSYALSDGSLTCMIPLMATGELHQSNLSTFFGDAFDLKLLRTNTSAPHVHSLHKYKGKFFPRLARYLINNHSYGIPTQQLLDPFVGSGTALVEASLLGISSCGVDIDKLSCAISQAKINALTTDPKNLGSAITELNWRATQEIPFPYNFPKAIRKKFVRSDTETEMEKYIQWIGRWMAAIAKAPNEYRLLFNIALSDALNRKFVMRMMGTGVGRFALEIAKTSLDSLMKANFSNLLQSIQTARSLQQDYRLSLGTANIYHGTATALPFPDAHFSMILTSPPYLPASSGREDYLIGKSISNLALGLMTEAEIEAADSNSVGSMKNNLEGGSLPAEVEKLVGWLENDELRRIKAQPTRAYYLSLQKALLECHRVLMPGGKAVFVIGKESVFYRFKTREVLYRVACDRIFMELAEQAGFSVESTLDIELDKKNKNARPRSLDSYYETAVTLSR
jgi:tRNA G10  N-methylase Trm11